MPLPASARTDRRETLRQLLESGHAATQQELVEALIVRGFHATQSSVSRDLRDLGAVKTAAGYELRRAGAADDAGMEDVAGLLRDVQPAGANLLVIRTAVGAAQRVALALDRSGWPEIVGNVGGDDTIFTATPNARAQRALMHRIQRATGRG